MEHQIRQHYNLRLAMARRKKDSEAIATFQAQKEEALEKLVVPEHGKNILTL
jgi:ACT domain-containing protein